MLFRYCNISKGFERIFHNFYLTKIYKKNKRENLWKVWLSNCSMTKSRYANFIWHFDCIYHKKKKDIFPNLSFHINFKIKTLCRVRIKKSKLIPLHFFMKLNVSMHTQPYIANAFILVIGKCTFFDVAVYRYDQKHNYFIKRFSWEIYEYGRNWGDFWKSCWATICGLKEMRDLDTISQRLNKPHRINRSRKFE